MTNSLDPNQQRIAWIQQWRLSASLLKDASTRELRNLTLADRQDQIRELLELADQFRKPRIDNGLVVLKQRLTELFGQESNSDEFENP